MIEPEQIAFTAETGGERLDKLIVAQLGERFSRAQIQALIADEHVHVNGAAAKPGWRVKAGDSISITVPPQPETPARRMVEPQDIPLTIVYEDDDLAVIDKPAGLVVHPGVRGETGTLAHAVLARYPQIAQIDYAPQRRGIVHRLDKETSGLIIIAKTALAMRRLMRQFAERTVEKQYLALTERPPKTRIGRIDAPIARDPANRKKMHVTRDGRPAVSEFTVIERFKSGHTLVQVNLLTGRTHQARVHLAFINCPLVGDSVYGFRRQRLGLRRQFLHAARLCFDQPQTGQRLCFESPLPPDLESTLAAVRRESAL